MKIAIASDDGQTVSPHFGRAPYFVVVTIEDGQVTGREQREKAAHVHTAGEPHQHGAGDAHHHTSMANSIRDCDLVVARGMGYPAYASMQAESIRPIVTDISSIDDVVRAIIAGDIVDHVERLH
jgi:predicted Fe-Mo cluster-binding NifX family protein